MAFSYKELKLIFYVYRPTRKEWPSVVALDGLKVISGQLLLDFFAFRF